MRFWRRTDPSCPSTVAGPTQGAGGANVTISNVKFTNDSAIGGAGGSGYYNNLTYRGGSYDNGGGGGLGGAGAGYGIGLGGGGVGSTANAAMGTTGNQTLPGNGIILGAADSGGMNPADPQPGFPAGDYYYASLWGGGGASASGGGVGGASDSYAAGGGFGGGGTDEGGHGGYGGGGGNIGNGGFGGGGGQFASGGYGAGAGGSGNVHRSGTYYSWYTTGGGGGGGGGLGAGGDIFVMHGGNLTIEGSLAQGTGTVRGGTGGPGAGSGVGLGQGIFLEGSAALTFAAPAGQVTQIAEDIADTGGKNSSVTFGTSTQTGTVVVTAANTYTGTTTVAEGTLQVDGSLADSATTVENGATLDGHGPLGAVTVGSGGTLIAGDSLSAPAVVTTGGLSLDSGSKYEVQIDGVTPGVNYGEIVADGPIDLAGTLDLQVSGLTQAEVFARTFPLIENPTGEPVSGEFAGIGSFVEADGLYFGVNYYSGASSGDYNAGTSRDIALVGPTYIGVNTFADLDAAIRSADAALPDTGQLEIDVFGTIKETADLAAINLAAGNSLTIVGEDGATLDGGDKHQGLFVYSGQVEIENLTIQNARAIGGAGGPDAGGGAGLGGGLFVAGTANGSANGGGHVTLENVVFKGDSATGGAGGAHSTFAPGGGGGLGGAGGASKFGGGGGGIDGAGGVFGSNGTAYGGAGIVAGAAGGGHGGGPGGYPGGASGGGGGGGTTGGGGGGIGGHNGLAGTQSYTGIGGAGGFGGGGGAGTGYLIEVGGAGGFGGGGGGVGGAGGFGGGGGGDVAAADGGFGAGRGGLISGGGGGLGAGGDVFVQAGGSLTVIGGSLSGGSVKGGAGAGGGAAGSHFGTGIFLKGNQGVTLAAAAGTTDTVSDVITDQAANGGVGAGSVTVGTSADKGTVVLAATDTYTGATTVAYGTLWVDGSIKSSATEVKSGATLGGQGTTGTVTVDAGGTLAPGDGPTAPSVLTSGNLSLASGAGYAVTIGSAGAGETVGDGTVNLDSDGGAGATLALQIASGFTPAVGQSYKLIDDAGGAAIEGTFAGLAEGAAVKMDGVTFALSYKAEAAART
jgi:hypothetical protein